MARLLRRPAGVTFLGAPFAPSGGVGANAASDSARFAFLGLPLYVPYGDEPVAPPAADGVAPVSAADAVRRASAGYATMLEHYDFELGGPLLRGGATPFVDCGDVALSGPLTADLAAGASAVRAIVASGAIPLVVAGDHSAPPVVVRGLPGDRPLDVLHVDAHLDFREDVAQLRDGYSSPIRRLRDLPWVRTIVQVGLRDVGSAREEEVVAARAAGNRLIRAEEVHEGGASGVDRLIELFEPGARVYITIDVDGLDPSCAPGTLWPAPGGLWFWQLARLVRGVATRCRLAGMDVCELVPSLDPFAHTSLAAARLLMIAAGAGRHASA